MNSTEKKKTRGNSQFKNVYILGTISLFNDISSEMIYPLIPSFIKSVLGLGSAFLGIVEGIAESTSSILKLFTGYFSDKIQKRKPFVVGGYTLSNITRPLIGFVSSWGMLLFLRFSDRVGKGIRTSPRDAMIAGFSPAGRRGFAFGFQRAMDHSGAVIGSITASLLIYFFAMDVRNVFLLSLIPGTIAVLLVIFGIKGGYAYKKRNMLGNKPEIKRSSHGEYGGGKGKIIRFSDFKKLGTRFPIFLVILIVFTLGNSTDAFLLLRASEFGIEITVIPLLWAVLHISKVLFGTLGGYMSDKIGRKIMILSGWLVYFLTYIGFAYVDKDYLIYVLFIVYGLYFGLTEGAERALIADIVPEKSFGTAYGFYNLSMSIATLPASIVFGFIWKAYNFKAAFLTGAVISAVASVMLIFLRFKKVNKDY
ncbi:MAG: MFS transporter [Actinomycetota bacterium]|nr:MFS transporter [Actinomycetota bacterium]